MTTNKIRRNEKLKLKGSFKKNGFDFWRLVANGMSVVSGEEKTFYIEFYVVNPALSQKECVLGFKNRFDKSAEDLHYVMAGTETAKNFSSQVFVKPAFFLVRAGVLSESSLTFNTYYPAGDVFTNKRDAVFWLKTQGAPECALGDDFTFGAVKVSKQDLIEHPEYMGNAGSLSWDLKFKKNLSFPLECTAKETHWQVLGAKSDFSGKVVLNGEEYAVTPKKSFGYYDKNWGEDFATPFFHLSSSNLTSAISGKLLESSAFVVQGEYKKRVSVLVSLEGKNIEFRADKIKKYSVNFDCQEVTDSENEALQLHWSVSVADKRHVIDIDIFSSTKEMSLRHFETPIGGRKVMKILAGGGGTGSFKVYKKLRKSLELIEQAEIAKCVCEYGNLETAEK